MTDVRRPPAPGAAPTAPMSMAPDEQARGGATAAVVEQGQEAASVAKGAAGEAVGTATEGARQVASEAAQQASDVGKEASAQARDLAQRAQSDLREQANARAQQAVQGLRDLGQQVRSLSEGRPQEGLAADVARQVATRIDDVASRYEQRGVEGAVEDLRRFARQRPGLFLLGAAATGFVATRFGRGLQAASQQQQHQQSPGPATAVAGAQPLGWQ